MFKFKTYHKSKEELQKERDQMNNKHMVFMKNLNKDVTEEILTSVISEKYHVTSVRVRQPNVMNVTYDTLFATLVLQEENKQFELLSWANVKGSPLNKLFHPEKVPFISVLQRKKNHNGFVDLQKR